MNRGSGMLAAVVLAGIAGAQPPAGQGKVSDQVGKLEGKTIVGVSAHGMKRVTEQALLAELGTRAGRKLSARTVRADLAFLWNRFKLQGRVFVRATEGGVNVRFVVLKDFFRYDHTVFRGLRHFTAERVRKSLGLDELDRLTELTAESLARRLEDLYERDGYANVRVRIRTDRQSSTLTLFVDEGPRAKVRSISFKGNVAFPDSAFLGLRWNLIGSAGVKSTPGFFGNAPFALATVSADLDRLRAFYRGRGYKDARVELYDIKFSPDYHDVDLVIRVFEGRRYVVDSVDIEQEGYPRGAKPLFPKQDLLDVIEIKPGDPVTQEALDRDKLHLSLFYGRRGFPSADEHRGLDAESSFRVLEPDEVVDPQRGRVKLIYRIKEGTRKRLRNIVIRGNRYTRDPVVRRELSVNPGEIINTEELSKSQDRLFALRYFGDPALGDPGVRLELRPVADQPALVDLDVDVKEGRTGQILWGVGISSNSGLFGNIQYDKRNFDWTRPPTGWNPIGWFAQILDNRAFHGGGQSLNLDLAPGTEVSQASATFFEPDLFGQHLDTIGLGLSVFSRLRLFETYDQHTTGARIRLEKKFGRNVTLGTSFTEQRIRISDIDPDAPAVVWDAEGKTSLRAFGLTFGIREVDFLMRPTTGYRVSTSFRYAPDWLGGGANFWKAGASSTLYFPLWRDSKDRAHVFEVRGSLNAAGALGDDEHVYLTERFFMGGQGTLRGFDFRRAGPTQFDRPTGGELRFLGTAEYSFPIYSSRLQGGLRETELVRGVVFVDAGMLGDGFGDPLFQQLRLAGGVGVRIRIPGLGGLPVALDFGWPLMRETTDRLQVFSFKFAFN